MTLKEKIMGTDPLGKRFVHVEDVKEFINEIKEKDLYRSLISKYGKVKVWNLNPREMIDLIEEYYNNKINQESGFEDSLNTN